MDVALRTEPETHAGVLAELLQQLLERTGVDLRDWRGAALEPRLRTAVEAEGVAGPEELMRRGKTDLGVWTRLTGHLIGRPQEWFSDAAFHQALRSRVAPLLKTYPSVRAWVPGEYGGEQAAALAIVLEEEGLLDRARIYATAPLEPALKGPGGARFSAAAVRAAAADYVKGGGKSSLDAYFAWDGADAVLQERLARHLVAGQHTIATDGSINEFHLIVCRRALLDYNIRLRMRAHRVFWESLPPLGILALPADEPPPSTFDYSALVEGAGLFRRTS
ncbi:MAG: hypothetical protein HY925_10440 [Elusimicrobia bacterium]|nr:hypothetical protein [Elusimicrobiota bacterium]